MKSYKSKYDIALSYVNSNFPKVKYSEVERKNVLRQMFAKLIVGFATIGRVDGKLKVQKTEIHQGINYKSETQRPW